MGTTTTTPDAGVVRVFAPPGPARHAVVAWARRHARRTGARVELLVDPDADGRPAPGEGDGGGSAVGGLLAGCAGVLGGLPARVPSVFRRRSSLIDRLARVSAGARMLVVPQVLPGVDDLVDTAYEPVTVVPDDPPHTSGPVVLAVAARTPDGAIGAAFEAAARRGAAVLALRLRDPDRWSVVPAVPAEYAAEETEDECGYWTDELSGWHLAYPDVPVEVRVGEGDPAAELVELSRRARLLVLGRSGRGRVLGAVAASPVGRVVRRARCPVLVVPPAGPPRHHWWPR